MDADWSVEIGAGLPWIEVPWEGWVDLRGRPTADEKIRSLAEVAAYPELADLLSKINTNHSLVITSKCDVFPIDIDSAPSLMLDDSGPGHEQDVHCGLGSYIDLIFCADHSGCSFAWYESLARRIATELLAPIPMPRVSVEIVIRQSRFFSAEGYGLTLYAMGFGASLLAARTTWAQIMRFSAYITMLEITSRVMENLKQGQGE